MWQFKVNRGRLVVIKGLKEKIYSKNISDMNNFKLILIN
jgi:hypothetical protein